MATGASVNVGRVVTSWHVGTHADAPLHVSPTGAPSELLPLGAFHGAATVLDASGAGPGSTITVSWLTEALRGLEHPARLLLRTGCCVASGQFPDAWPALTPDAADWLTGGGLKLFGTDAPSVDARSATNLVVHHALFGGGAYVLENLSLEGVPVGEYRLSAYPVLVSGADAAPVRAVLEDTET
jgi:arylformamidase